MTSTTSAPPAYVTRGAREALTEGYQTGLIFQSNKVVLTEQGRRWSVTTLKRKYKKDGNYGDPTWEAVQVRGMAGKLLLSVRAEQGCDSSSCASQNYGVSCANLYYYFL